MLRVALWSLAFVAAPVAHAHQSLCSGAAEYPPTPMLCSSVCAFADEYVQNLPFHLTLSNSMLDNIWPPFMGGNRYVPASASVVNRRLVTRQALWIVQISEAPPPFFALLPYVAPALSLSSRETLSSLTRLGENYMYGTDYERVLTPADSPSSTTPVTVTPPHDLFHSARTLKWLPVVFEERFLLTCYVLSEEHLFSGPTVAAPGLDPNVQYKAAFLKDVRMQGSGKAADGAIIHYDGGDRYSYQSCPLTASGQCAVDGTTVAIDRSKVPIRSALSIFHEGAHDIEIADLRATDTGGAIKGPHIDGYFGTRRNDCLNWGKRYRAVRFDHYL